MGIRPRNLAAANSTSGKAKNFQVANSGTAELDADSLDERNGGLTCDQCGGYNRGGPLTKWPTR